MPFMKSSIKKKKSSISSIITLKSFAMLNLLSRESVKLSLHVLKPLPMIVRSSDLSGVESFNRRHVLES